jgi:hypothetical protein
MNIKNELNDVDLECYKSIRQEITDRIKIHYTLIGTKLLIIGGIFSLLSKSQNSVTISPFLMSGLIAFFFDIVLVDNLGWIRGAGKFIKKNIEDKNYTHLMWESHFAQPDEKCWCFDMWTYLLGIWSIGTILMIIGLIQVLILPLQNKLFPSYFLGIAGLCLAVYSFIKVVQNLSKKASR